jgi:anthranilate phosphoribosyltransferase
MDLPSAIARVVERSDLSFEEMAEATGLIMDGRATPAQIGALLAALRMKGETVSELKGAASAMRARALPFRAPEGVVVDTCGTGGDGRGTLNISTLAALVVAAAGVRVAKHGNRAQSSKAGSADLLEALGVDVSAEVPVVERCLDEVGIGFLFAPAFHQATRHASSPRREIGVRTLFNLLGPLTNPARVKHQVIGVYAPDRADLMARALSELGSERALVVHGQGLDEFAPSGATQVVELNRGAIHSYRLEPRDFGLEDSDAVELTGGDVAANADGARAILAGARGAGRNCVVMTAAAALYVAGANNFLDGARRAEQLIDDGSAKRLLERWVAASRNGSA